MAPPRAAGRGARRDLPQRDARDRERRRHPVLVPRDQTQELADRLQRDVLPQQRHPLVEDRPDRLQHVAVPVLVLGRDDAVEHHAGAVNERRPGWSPASFFHAFLPLPKE